MLGEIIHLSHQRAKGDLYPPLLAKSNSRISQWRNFERVFAPNANGASKQSDHHSLLPRNHQHTWVFVFFVFFYTPCLFQ